jgi:hypothetical protein
MMCRYNHIADKLLFTTLAFFNFSALCWADPPPPPVITAPPATPLGGAGITIATAVAIAGYGYWKNRK